MIKGYNDFPSRKLNISMYFFRSCFDTSFSTEVTVAFFSKMSLKEVCKSQQEQVTRNSHRESEQIQYFEWLKVTMTFRHEN